MRDRIRVVPLVAAIALFAIISSTVLDLPRESAGLSEEMIGGAAAIHVNNVVTAVLLDFRGYDTLLEISVLMLATVAVLSLRDPRLGTRRRLTGTADLILRSLGEAVTPIMMVVAGYLVWVGSTKPGGAFQAGAVLGAGGILLALTGWVRPSWARHSVIRLVLSVGLLAFIAVSVTPILAGRTLLDYSDDMRHIVLLILESILTLSISASMLSLFLASASGGEEDEEAS